MTLGGQVFAGFDHYHIQPVTHPTWGSGTRVTVWNDDPVDWPAGTRFAEVWEWYTPGPDPTFGAGGFDQLQALIDQDTATDAEARTRMQAWAADPSHWPINTRWRVTVFAEDPQRRRQTATRVSADGAPFVAQRWNQFTPPATNVRHGIWLDDALADTHKEVLADHQRVVGWRDYTAELDVAETRDGGRLMSQRTQDRYLPSSHTITWYWHTTTRANTAHDAGGWASIAARQALERTADSGDTFSAAAAELTWNDAEENAELSLVLLATPANDPNQGTWPTGTYRVQADIFSLGGSAGLYFASDYGGGTHFQRWTSGLSSAVTSTQITGGNVTTTGLALRSVASWAPSGSTASDRFGVRVAIFSADMMSSQTIVFTCDADAFVDGPWVEGGGDPNTRRCSLTLTGVG